MTIADLQTYLPFGDLVKIVAVCLGIAVVAPTAAAFAIHGLDQRQHAQTAAAGTIRIAAGVGVLALLVAVGLYALVAA